MKRRLPRILKPRLEFAPRVARRASELILGYYQSESLAVETKRDTSPVTAADRGAEELIRKAIEREFPGDGVLGEELGESLRQTASAGSSIRSTARNRSFTACPCSAR